MAKSGSLLAEVVDDIKAAFSSADGRLDPDMREVLEAQASLKPRPIEDLDPVEARLQPTPADGVKKLLRDRGVDPDDRMGVVTEDIDLPGDIAARLYYPGARETGQILPVVVYFHGGGFVIADVDTYDATPRNAARKIGALVVAVEYRRAPESKFPAAHDDAFNAYKWIMENVESLGGDPRRIAVMGESAGGNLAINVCIAARDAGLRLPVHQVLIYPLAGTDISTKSYQENADAKPLNKSMMEWFVKHATRGIDDLQDPRLNIVGKADLHGLPPATVITAEIDPLRSEGKLLAQKLESANIAVNAKCFDGVTHEFFGMGTVVAKARQAEEMAHDDLIAAFSL